ncbi:probable protein arginine N-methyltransferase 3 [Cynara cardunculus var. scolymus]|uniref:Protein arginine N-methyltransferase n=1 Tax=Cynara cardunculus var. scolymus TaxID=59895 RepID=A0A103XML2_CYNCS|nr:probable protein arginine N-methyltransferase 3 [Cynara cardunculus var. scolymus]KVH93500.1 Protein arginine N-methyltransferase [Cynara cardunculus var. scolymus]
MVAPLYKNLEPTMGDNEEDVDADADVDVDDEQNWEDWTAEGEGEDDDLELLCLFCDSKYSSANSLFEHCHSSHSFDFGSIRTTMKLDFYGCFKLLNYVRSQVARNQCWSCGSICQSRQELQDHLHEQSGFESNNLPWDNDMYLKPYMEEDHLLYSFGEDEEVDDDDIRSADEDLARIIKVLGKTCIDDRTDSETSASISKFLESCKENAVTEVVSVSKNNGASYSDGAKVNSKNAKLGSAHDGVSDDKKSNDSSVNPADSEIIIVNKSYFGSYGSFGIHREMISDKVRTDAYRQAIVDNPSLIKGAVVLDVGCGTGILSLFAAQAGASTVNAVEASDKMASVATQIAKNNGLLWNQEQGSGVVKVVNGMVEDLIVSGKIEPQSVDVLVSEWMGYCLLYESMLSSVLVARDHWLKPGGAVLPDTATMFVAGFGKGATSIPFWENVYGFNMSCIGNELVEDASHIPIVDVVDGNDLVTNTALLQVFDLVTMKPDEVDFTASVQLEQKSSHSAGIESTVTKCYGIVLWFETSFTSRFCKEMPTVLSTSPYTPPTHWSQTLLTFREPISLSKMLVNGSSSTVGTDVAPAVKIDSRISIARGVEHRSIDISLEVTAIGFDGRKRQWPVQMFHMR